MSTIAKTAFEAPVTNMAFNATQNVTGKYQVLSGSSYVADICPSGFLCTERALMPNDGYQGLGASGVDILNGNAWYMIKAATGKSGSLGDHTGIYAFNSFDVRKVASGDNVWNLGANYLGLELPKDVAGDFTEIIVGEQYTFGEGNFSTLPSGATAIYVTIANGLLMASASAPSAGDGVYFTWERPKSFTVGVRDAGFSGYVLKACRA